MRAFQKILVAVSASLAMACVAGQVQAASWLVTYTATNNAAPFGADLTVTTDDTANGDGSFNVTAISGAVDNGSNTDTATALFENTNTPGWSYSPDGRFMFDNLLMPDSARAVSWFGLMFSGASGDEYNLYSDDASTYELWRANAGGYQASSIGVVSVSAAEIPGFSTFDRGLGGGNAVPEPGVWLLMILGFGATGAALRRQRRRLPAA